VPLRTLHVNTERGWRGGEQQMAYLVEGLRERGHDVTLVLDERGEVAPRLEARGFRVERRRMGGEADLLSMIALAKTIRRLRPEVLHLHTSHAHSLGAMGARWGGAQKPVVIVSRRVDFSIYRHSFLHLNGWKYRRGLDRIVCVSDAIRGVLLRDGLSAERIRVVRSAIDPARIREASPVDVRARLGLPRDCVLVLAVGALVEHKGHRHLVDALPAVKNALPVGSSVRVLIAGEGPLRSVLAARARELGVSDVLVLAGQVNDLPGWFSGVEVYAMPSVEEGLGTSALDAMAAGLPVVASRAGGLPEMVTGGVEGLLVPPADPSALAAALLRLLRDPAERARMGAAGRRRVDAEFLVDRMVEGTIAVYEEAIAERRAQAASRNAR
jgi:glycosyltransferase involved in cell wall biosynthesis